MLCNTCFAQCRHGVSTRAIFVLVTVDPFIFACCPVCTVTDNPVGCSQVKTGYTDDTDFDPEKVKKGSVAAAGLCKWVHAMVVYNRVAKVVGPKRVALAEAESTLAQAMSDLSEKQAMLKVKTPAHLFAPEFPWIHVFGTCPFTDSRRLAGHNHDYVRRGFHTCVRVSQDLMDKLATLQHQLKEAEDKKVALQHQVRTCNLELDTQFILFSLRSFTFHALVL